MYQKHRVCNFATEKGKSIFISSFNFIHEHITNCVVYVVYLQGGCCCREHQVLVTTSDNCRSVYSIVTYLKDVVCKPPISSCYQQQQQTQQQPFQGYSATATPGFTSLRTKTMDTALTGLLQTQQKRSISSITLSKKRDSATSELHTDYGLVERAGASCGPNIAASRQQQHVQSPQLSELEEDEEENKKAPHYAANKSKKKGSKKHKQ